MQVKYAEYSSEWIGKYIDKKTDEFAPVLDGDAAYRTNHTLWKLGMIFIICTCVYVMWLYHVNRWEASRYSTYIMAALMGVIILNGEWLRDMLNPMRQCYRECAGAFRDLLTGLYNMQDAYNMLRSLQKNLDVLIKQDPEKALELVAGNNRNELSPDFTKNGVIDFTGMDRELEQYMALMDQLEQSCRENKMMK